MARPGPARTPTIIQLKRGDPGGRAKKRFDSEMRPPSEKIICPAFLSKTAKAEWRRIMSTLGRMERDGQRLVTELDRAALAAYCQAWSDLETAVTHIELNGTTIDILDSKGRVKYVQQSPQVAMKNKAYSALKMLAAEFGFTPSARSRIPIVQAQDDPGEFARKAGFIK